MPRVLPWLTGNTAATKQNRQPGSPAKRQRLLDPDTNFNLPPSPTEPVARARERSDRTPSSSPPPLAAPTLSPLRPGFDHDDIFVMVEDEFLAAAQTFTRHLHHAEYHRLKTLAKHKKATNIKNISRPTDGKTVMRDELKRKKQGDIAAARTKNGIEGILAKAKGPGDGAKDDASQESEFEMDRSDEPWQGTQLQRFMTATPRKDFRSLTGLQGVISHTRAAAGYEKSDNRSPSHRKQTNRLPDNVNITDQEDDSEEDDTNDLDAPLRAPSRAPSQPNKKSKPHMQPVSLLRERPKPIKPSAPAQPKCLAPRSLLDLSPLPEPVLRNPGTTEKQPTPSSKTTLKSFGGRLRPVGNKSPDPAAAIRAKLKARREREESEKNKSSGDVEIPLFLI